MSGQDAADYGQGQVADCCEQGNEPLGSMKCGDFLYWLMDCCLPKKGGVRYSGNC
jgi:hypothetical protein